MPKVIVLVADVDDPKHGEIAVLDSHAEAERLVEVLLEAGTPPGRVRVFAGGELEAQVSQKPRVELVACEWAESRSAPPADQEVAPAPSPSPWDTPVPTAPVTNGSFPADGGPSDLADEEPDDDEADEEPAEDGSEASPEPATPDAGPSEGSLTLLRRLPVRPVELMPELKH